MGRDAPAAFGITMLGGRLSASVPHGQQVLYTFYGDEVGDDNNRDNSGSARN